MAHRQRRRNLRVIPKIRQLQRGVRFARPGDPRKPYRPTRPTRVDIFSIEPEDRVTVISRDPVLRADRQAELERRATPRSVVNGTVHERIVYRELTKRHIPFDFQGSFEHGRGLIGGAVADFILRDRPLIIEVQGSVWHSGLFQQHQEAWRAEVLNAAGFTVVFLYEWIIEDEIALSDWFRHYIDVPVVHPPPSGRTFQTFVPSAAAALIQPFSL